MTWAIRSAEMETARSRMQPRVSVPVTRVEPFAVAVGGSLTPRQRDVLAVLATGCTQAEAGNRLGITEDTVKNLTHDAYGRLGVGGLVEAFVVLGWLRVPD